MSVYLALLFFFQSSIRTIFFFFFLLYKSLIYFSFIIPCPKRCLMFYYFCFKYYFEDWFWIFVFVWTNYYFEIMDYDSLSFGYTEIKLNTSWERRGGGDWENFERVSWPHLPSLRDRHTQEYIWYLYLYFRMPKM